MKKRPTRAPASRPPRTKLPVDLFQKAFHHSPAMQSVVRAADGAFVEVNDTFLQKLGFTRAQVVGRTAVDLGFWVDADVLADYRAELMAQGRVPGREVRLRSRVGTVLTVLLSTHPIDVAGERYFLSAGVDLTLRKEAEAKLRESERRLRESEGLLNAAFQASPVLLTIAPLATTKIVRANDAFVRMSGYAIDEILGRNTNELGLWVSLEERAKFFDRLQRDRVVRDHEAQLRSRDGDVRDLQLSGALVNIHAEPHLIIFGLDVTERKRAEAELQRTLAKERELNQLKSDFVALVSHEFRTPLEVIMSSADNLERYHDRLPVEKRTHLLRTIHKSVARMSDMMEEVLLLGRLESGATEFAPTTIDLVSFCRRVHDEMESATNRRCPITLSIDAATDAGRGDEAVLRHIFTNLLSNAVKYSEAGRPVEFAMQREADDAVFRVTDRGCGIPAADQGRLFQAFHRGGNVRHVPGTGLGLVIVQRSVALHGGRISCESTEGQGTTFTVRLPLFSVPS